MSKFYEEKTHTNPRKIRVVIAIRTNKIRVVIVIQTNQIRVGIVIRT